MPGRLDGKVAVITGGGHGFGEGIAAKFIQERAKVVLCDIVDANGKRVANELGCVYVHADVSQRSGWEKILETAIHRYGKLDIVVNNAGYCHNPTPTTAVTEVDFDRMVNVNVKSLFHSTNVLLPYFVSHNKPGAYVNVASASAKRPRPGLTWYGASKAAVVNAIGAMASEYASNKIRFNAVNPAAGMTGMTKDFLAKDETESKFLETIPLGRLCQPLDVANAVCFLASDDASFITGVALDVDGGRAI